MKNIQNPQPEKWKWIKGFEQRYKVSDQGRIKSYCRKTPRLIEAKVKKSKNDHYKYVQLHNDNGVKRLRVNRLVAFAFIQGHFPGAVCHHKNDKTLDNRAENLEWITNQRNIALSPAYARNGLPCNIQLSKFGTYQVSIAFGGVCWSLGGYKKEKKAKWVAKRAQRVVDRGNELGLEKRVIGELLLRLRKKPNRWRGVYDTENGTWQVRIRWRGKVKNIGSYKDREIAGKVATRIYKKVDRYREKKLLDRLS